jgi:hypothetical protein
MRETAQMRVVNKGMAAPDDHYAALLAASRGSNSVDLRSGVDGVRQRLDKEFLQSSSNTQPDTTLFASLSIKLEKLLVDSIANGKSGIDLGEGISQLVASEWFHYRMLKARFKRQQRGSNFALMFGRFGFAMSAAVVCEAGPARDWFVHHFKVHFESGYECPNTPDREFLNFCYAIAQRCDSSTKTMNGAKLGTYLGIGESAGADGFSKACALRLGESYRQIVEDSPGAAYYGTRFPALYPFELLAAMKLMSIAVSDVDSPLVRPFASARFSDPLAVPFNQSCDRSVSAFEQLTGGIV